VFSIVNANIWMTKIRDIILSVFYFGYFLVLLSAKPEGKSLTELIKHL